MNPNQVVRDAARFIGVLRTIRYFLRFPILSKPKTALSTIGFRSMDVAALRAVFSWKGDDGFYYRETTNADGTVNKEQFYDAGLTRPTDWSAVCDPPQTDENGNVTQSATVTDPNGNTADVEISIEQGQGPALSTGSGTLSDGTEWTSDPATGTQVTLPEGNKCSATLPAGDEDNGELTDSGGNSTSFSSGSSGVTSGTTTDENGDEVGSETVDENGVGSISVDGQSSEVGGVTSAPAESPSSGPDPEQPPEPEPPAPEPAPEPEPPAPEPAPEPEPPAPEPAPEPDPPAPEPAPEPPEHAPEPEPGPPEHEQGGENEGGADEGGEAIFTFRPAPIPSSRLKDQLRPSAGVLVEQRENSIRRPRHVDESK